MVRWYNRPNRGGVVMDSHMQREALTTWAGILSNSMVVRDTRAVEAAFPTLASVVDDADGPLTTGVVRELHDLALRLTKTPIPWEVQGLSRLLRQRLRDLLATLSGRDEVSAGQLEIISNGYGYAELRGMTHGGSQVVLRSGEAEMLRSGNE